MNKSANEVEAIVRAIVAQLRSGPDSPLSAGTASTVPAPSVSVSTTEHVLCLPDRVVSLSALEGKLDTRLGGKLDGKLDGIRQVRVARTAIVTPAVQDALRERGIQLVRQSETDSSAAVQGKLYLHRTNSAWDLDPLIRSLSSLVGIESLVACPVEQAIGELAAVLGSSKALGLLVTDNWAEAQGLANRARSVRAFAAFDVRMVKSAGRDWNPNLMVVDPSCCTIREMILLTREYLQCESAK